MYLYCSPGKILSYFVQNKTKQNKTTQKQASKQTNKTKKQTNKNTLYTSYHITSQYDITLNHSVDINGAISLEYNQKGYLHTLGIYKAPLYIDQHNHTTWKLHRA